MKSVIRRKRPNYIKCTPEITAGNILNRNFTAEKLNEKWLTDVTEFKYGNSEKLYLSAILDLKDKSIVSYVIGRRNNAFISIGKNLDEIHYMSFDEFWAHICELPDACRYCYILHLRQLVNDGKIGEGKTCKKEYKSEQEQCEKIGWDIIKIRSENAIDENFLREHFDDV